MAGDVYVSGLERGRRSSSSNSSSEWQAATFPFWLATTSTSTTITSKTGTKKMREMSDGMARNAGKEVTRANKKMDANEAARQREHGIVNKDMDANGVETMKFM